MIDISKLWQVLQGDCLEVMADLPDNSIDAVITDPPYYRVKGLEWDRQWENQESFISWVGLLSEQWQRILKPNGSLYVFASPRMAARVEVEIARRFNVLNRIVWRKHDGTKNEGGLWSRSNKETLRRFFEQKEEIIFAEHYGADNIAKGEAGYVAKCDELRGFVFEPLRAYIFGEYEKSGVNPDHVANYLGVTPTMVRQHYLSKSQWALPTKASYEKQRAALNALTGGDYLRREYEDLRREYEDLRREYEDLRREYEDLRRPFNVSPDVPYTDVWSFETVRPYAGKHPCEKPRSMMRHIIESSTKPGAMVLDCFSGSGVTGEQAVICGRSFIGIERDPVYVEAGRARIENAHKTQMELAV